MASQEVFLKEVRLANGYLFKPYNKANSRGELKYRGTFLFPPGSEQDKLCQQAIMKVAAEEFGENWAKIVAAMESSKKCLRQGDTAIDNAGNVREGFAGMKYVSSANKDKPLVIGPRKNAQGKFDPLDPSGGKPYNGCIVTAKIEITAMKAFEDAPNNIYAKLLTVQYVRDSERFKGGASAPSADGFDEVEGAEEVATVGSDDPFAQNDDPLAGLGL